MPGGGSGEHRVPKRVETPFDIDDLLPAIVSDVEDAVDFCISEFEDDFEKANFYYNGGTDLEDEEGRSTAVDTVVRDSIRNMMPSVMRVLASNRKRLVKYKPNTMAVARAVEQQEVFVHQLFWANDGYMMLYNAVLESFLHRMCAVKTQWDADPTPEFTRVTMLTLDEVQFLSEMDDIEILSIDPSDVPSGGETEVEFYDVECLREASNGSIVMEALPYGEFFISRNARSVKDARVHGHRRSVTVAEALEMGLEYDDWWDLDDEDPEQAKTSGESTERRGTQKHEENDRGDLTSHRFLLTEVYVRMDLEDVGYEQLYRLSLGGTSYELIAYEREGESPFDILVHDPKAFTVHGNSIADIAIHPQDVATSLLRGMLDNVHLANNPRLGANPQQVNFDDLMSWQMGHPIRFKGQGQLVQVIEVPSQIQSTLPLKQYIDQMNQEKIGVTKAAQGLDPNAMQSTDKQAVQNTIQLSQGQVELAVRNLIESGIIGIFRKLLKLSIQHRDRYQMIAISGMVLPVDQMMFDPDLYAEPQVGLGTVTDEQRMMGLQLTLQTQLNAIQQFGMDNPFVGMANIYNTLEDLTEMFGLYDVSRYYKIVTPEVEKQFAEARAQQAAAAEQAGKGMDPVMGLIQTEQIKAGTEKLKTIVQARSKATEMQLQAMKYDADDDRERDKMAQEREIQSAKVLADGAIKVDQNEIKREQNAARAKPSDSLPSKGEAAA